MEGRYVYFSSDSDFEEPPATMAFTSGRRTRDESYCFKDTEYCSAIFAKFNEQRQEGRFVDCIVRVGSVKVPVHRSVMAACSPYFDALWRFNSSVDGSSSVTEASTIVEVSLDANIMSIEAIHALVDFAYSGSINITYSNVKEILKGADFLCMTSVSMACCRYLQEILDCNIAIEVFQFACSINNEKLADDVVCFIARHFYEFLSQGLLYSVDVDLLTCILAHDELVVMEEFPFGLGLRKQFYFVTASRQEEIVFRYIVEYVRQRKDKSVLPQILRNCVRFSLITPDSMRALEEMDCVVRSEECLLLLRQARYRAASACHLPEIELKSRNLSGVMERKLSKKLATHVFDEVAVSDFDDSTYLTDADPVLYVTGMKFYSRRWDGRRVIGGIEVSYSNGIKLLHGATDYGYEIDEFVLDTDERIIGVTAQSGWMIDGLSFETNKRSNLGPFGGDGGGRRVIERPAMSAYLAFMKGKVMTTQDALAVRHLQFGWVYYKDIM